MGVIIYITNVYMEKKHQCHHHCFGYITASFYLFCLRVLLEVKKPFFPTMYFALVYVFYTAVNWALGERVPGAHFLSLSPALLGNNGRVLFSKEP